MTFIWEAGVTFIWEAGMTFIWGAGVTSICHHSLIHVIPGLTRDPCLWLYDRVTFCRCWSTITCRLVSAL
jgi:hypothetical protein